MHLKPIRVLLDSPSMNTVHSQIAKINSFVCQKYLHHSWHMCCHLAHLYLRVVYAGQVQWAELHHGEAPHLPSALPVLALQLHHPLPPQAVCPLH